MIEPSIVPWIEQSRELARLRIDSGDVWPLVQIAVLANQCKILFVLGPAVLSGNDVVNSMANANGCLWDEAVFTPTAGTLPHQYAQGIIHDHSIRQNEEQFVPGIGSMRGGFQREDTLRNRTDRPGSDLRTVLGRPVLPFVDGRILESRVAIENAPLRAAVPFPNPRVRDPKWRLPWLRSWRPQQFMSFRHHIANPQRLKSSLV